MIEFDLNFELPAPWTEKVFHTNQIGEINFLVGPNGSGKSQFARRLYNALTQLGQPLRLLGTERLTGMEQVNPFQNIRSPMFGDGLGKDLFESLKQAGSLGAGIDAIVLLEERMDLRIQVEATLGHLFNREIILEWDSGRLVPKVRRKGEDVLYRIDREECHGIKELLVLLTHLYDDKHRFLIIDEPELNLHPQYQAFFMQEARKATRNPESGESKKVIFLVTHSPFVLDLRSKDDLDSVISFDLEYSVPKQVATLDVSCSDAFVRRLNANHKQLFFSDNPVFVEGIFDAWIVQAIIETLGASLSGAGSCVIDANGVDQVNQYLKLCQGLRKNAHFLYDLDALFIGTLRRSINDDESIQSFLVTAGLGNDFGKYCGDLEKKITGLIDQCFLGPLASELAGLQAFLDELGPRCQWQKEQNAKARVAFITAIGRHRQQIISKSSETSVRDVSAHLTKILAALREKNIHVLPGGALENYLPSFNGSEFDPTPEEKRNAVLAELETITSIKTEEDLASRYGHLFEVVRGFPSKDTVNVDVVLHKRLATYIHGLQQLVVEYPDWDEERVRQRLYTDFPEYTDVFTVPKFEKQPGNKFQATILVANLLSQGSKHVEISDQTNAGMGHFVIKPAVDE